MPSKSKVVLILVPLALGGVALAVLGALNPTNLTQTQPDHADARLRTRRYRCSLQTARETILATIPSLQSYGASWRVISSESNVVRAEVPVLMFTDDIVVTVNAEQGGVVLDVRSAARMGKSDMGENRRHVLQLLAALDEKLAQ
jgi:uncharacterized protein (DUF1499 family)